jgi:hypothetical protein
MIRIVALTGFHIRPPPKLSTAPTTAQALGQRAGAPRSKHAMFFGDGGADGLSRDRRTAAKDSWARHERGGLARALFRWGDLD